MGADDLCEFYCDFTDEVQFLLATLGRRRAHRRQRHVNMTRQRRPRSTLRYANAGTFAYDDCQATAGPGGKAVVVAQHEEEVAMAARSCAHAGADYVVEVTSRVGAVATGSYSNADCANGLPVLGRVAFSANTSRWVLRPPYIAHKPNDLFYLGSNDGGAIFGW